MGLQCCGLLYVPVRGAPKHLPTCSPAASHLHISGAPSAMVSSVPLHAPVTSQESLLPCGPDLLPNLAWASPVLPLVPGVCGLAHQGMCSGQVRILSHLSPSLPAWRRSSCVCWVHGDQATWCARGFCPHSCGSLPVFRHRQMGCNVPLRTPQSKAGLQTNDHTFLYLQ